MRRLTTSPHSVGWWTHASVGAASGGRCSRLRWPGLRSTESRSSSCTSSRGTRLQSRSTSRWASSARATAGGITCAPTATPTRSSWRCRSSRAASRSPRGTSRPRSECDGKTYAHPMRVPKRTNRKRAHDIRKGGPGDGAALSVLADVCDLRVRGVNVVCGLEPERLLVRAALQDDRVAVGDPPVDEDGIVARAAERRHRSQLEVGVVAPQVVLGCKVHLLLAGPEQLAELVRVDAAVAGNNHPRVTVGCGDDDRLRDV